MSVRTYKLALQLESMRRLLKEERVVEHLLVVDVQPEYENAFGFSVDEFCTVMDELHDRGTRLTILYNGEDTLGMISEQDYRMWLLDNGMSEDLAFSISMYDKGYAFFRYCIDEGIDEGQIVQLVKEMMAMDVNDSRDLDEQFWTTFVERHGHKDIRELMEFSDDCISIPDLMDELRSQVSSGVYLTGGGLQECFKEVEIALQALDISYKVYTKFTY